MDDDYFLEALEDLKSLVLERTKLKYDAEDSDAQYIRCWNENARLKELLRECDETLALDTMKLDRTTAETTLERDLRENLRDKIREALK